MPHQHATSLTAAHAPGYRTADCDLDDFVSLVVAADRPRRLPARRPRRATNVLVYDVERRCGRPS